MAEDREKPMKKYWILVLVAVVLAVACGLQSASWPVNCTTTTLKQLDKRYTDELYDLHVAEVCKAAYGGDNFTECPAYHALWRRYWAAKRELDKCVEPPAPTDRNLITL
jgi:hypothetical protein